MRRTRLDCVRASGGTGPCVQLDERALERDFFFFSSRRRHTRLQGDWSSDVCSSDLPGLLVAAPLDWRAYLAAFVLFRVFDIVKPWPVRAIERRVAGGLGIMLDDVAAALYAILLLLIGEGVFGVRP